MTPYEKLLEIAANEGISVIDYDLGEKTLGLYCDGIILVNKNADEAEKYCTLAEELGHYCTASCNIVETNTIEKCKEEQLGRRWGFDTILPIEKIIDAVIDGCDNFYTVAEYLGITTEYLHEALRYYSQRYGPEAEYGDYLVIFSEESLIVHPVLDDIYERS